MTEFNEGDKLRVTFETVASNGGYPGRSYKEYTAVTNYSVEVIERADDPARDPVYTVRSADSVDYRKKILFIKTGPNAWYEVTPPGRVPFDTPIYDENMTDTEVVGTVPIDGHE